MQFQLCDGLTGCLGCDALSQCSLPDAAEFHGFGEHRDGLKVIDRHGQFF